MIKITKHTIAIYARGWPTLLNTIISIAVVLAGCAAVRYDPAQRAVTPAQSIRQNTQISAAEKSAYLLFGPVTLEQLRQRASTTHQPIWSAIKQFSDSQLDTIPPSSPPLTPIEPADNELDTYRNLGNQLIAMAFICAVDNDIPVCDLTKRYMLAYATWNQWGEENQRGLGHAHMVFGNALAYNWMHDHLSGAEQQVIRASLANWTNRLYEATATTDYNEQWLNWWPRSYAQNHHWIIHSALGIAALALMNDDSRAPVWLDHAVAQMTRVRDLLNGINDGTWHEGLPYQNYALSMAIPFWLSLRQEKGIDLIPHAYLKNYTLWRTYNHIVPHARRPQFIIPSGDFEWSWANGFQPQAILRFIAANENDGRAEWMAQQLLPTQRSVQVWAAPWNVFEFLYFDPAIVAMPPITLPHAYDFKDAEATIWRTGWGEHDLVFGFKSGAPGGRFAFDTFTKAVYPWDAPCLQTDCSLNTGHDHDDTNSFYLFKDGQWLAPETVRNDGKDTSLHNTILIDGAGQYSPSEADGFKDPAKFEGVDGHLQMTANTPTIDYLMADATQRYRGVEGLTAVKRHVVFVRPGYLVMLDQLSATTPHTYTWVSHFDQSVSVEGNWVRGQAADQQILGVGVVAPSAAHFVTGNDGQPFVHLQSDPFVTDVRFASVLLPTNVATWSARPTISLVEDNGNAIALRVRQKDGSTTDDIMLSYGREPYAAGQPLVSASIGAYRYDGQVAVLTHGVQGELKRIFVNGATYLKDRILNQKLIDHLDPRYAVEVTYTGETVGVYGDVQDGLVLYAPSAQLLIVNGISRAFLRTGDFITLQ